MHLVHKWKHIKYKTTKHCLGEEYESTSATEYDICPICDTIKRYMYDSGGGARYCLEDAEEEIVRKKLKNEELFYEN